MAGPITGNLGAFAQPGRWGKDSTGNFTIWTFEGTKNEVALLARNYSMTLGLQYEVTESFGKFRLDVHFPWGMNVDPATDYVENWEFFANHVEKDLLEASVESTAIAALSRGQKSVLKNLLLNPPQGGTNDPYPTRITFQPRDDPDGVQNNTSADNALAVWALMCAGVRSFPVEQPILRRTVITSSRWAIPASLTNVRAILSTATLISLESMPLSLLFNLPTDTSAVSGLAYGWYKQFPTIQQTALFKWQIVQEWQYGLWATLIWGSPL